MARVTFRSNCNHKNLHLALYARILSAVRNPEVSASQMLLLQLLCFQSVTRQLLISVRCSVHVGVRFSEGPLLEAPLYIAK